MPKLLKWGLLAVVVMTAAVWGSPDRASAAPILFRTDPTTPASQNQGDVTSFSAVLTGSGNSTIIGAQPITGDIFGSPFVFSPQTQNTAIYLLDPNTKAKSVTVTSKPTSVGTFDSGTSKFTPSSTNIEVTHQGLGLHITALTGANVDLLNGKTSSFALNTIKLSILNISVQGGQTFTSPADLTIDVSAKLKQLWVEQTGQAVFTDGAFGTGTFSIPGRVHGLLDAPIALDNFNVTTLSDTKIDTDLTVAGSYTVQLVNVPGQVDPWRRITLTGSQNLSLPLSLATAFNLALAGVAGMTGTVALDASINLALNFQLQDTVPIPEPGAVVLLGIGLIAALPLATSRLRRHRKRRDSG